MAPNPPEEHETSTLPVIVEHPRGKAAAADADATTAPPPDSTHCAAPPATHISSTSPIAIVASEMQIME